MGEAPHGSPIAGLEAWRGLPQWEDEAPLGTAGIACRRARGSARAAGKRLVRRDAARTGRLCDAATYAFGPREQAGAPQVALVEAGTGIGKTLGYLAPASLWAEKNGPGLWISTYTRNLQRQIVQEIAHLWPDPVERAEKAVVRKGRENYLCLLNFEEAAKRTALAPGQRTRGAGADRALDFLHTDGDLSGRRLSRLSGSSHAALHCHRPARRMHLCRLPALPHLLYRARHPPRPPCAASWWPIMRWSSRRPAQDWLGEDETTDTPTEKKKAGACAMSSTKAIICSMRRIPALPPSCPGREMAELRRWIRGPEGRARSRMRGLEERLKDLIADDEAAQSALEEAVQAAAALAGEGWT